MDRGYQYDFAANDATMHNIEGRTRKAETMVAVLADKLGANLSGFKVLDVGASTGIIDSYLADHFFSVTCVDIDEAAISGAKEKYLKHNLSFQIGDAMNLQFDDSSFDVVICSHIYEHVPSAEKLMQEIYRVLKPGGICFFAADNRFILIEPHYRLPLLSAIPRLLSHHYLRLFRNKPFYHELLYSPWALKKLVSDFELDDYTEKIIFEPLRFKTEYMLKPGSLKEKLARLIVRYFYFICPGYIWLLTKPGKMID